MALTPRELKSRKSKKLGEQIRRILADLTIKGELDRFNLPYFTVTEVKMKGVDFAKIFISGMPDKTKEATDILNENKQTIRYELAKYIKARTIPEIGFYSDTTYEKGEKIENILKNLDDI